MSEETVDTVLLQDALHIRTVRLFLCGVAYERTDTLQVVCHKVSRVAIDAAA